MKNAVSIVEHLFYHAEHSSDKKAFIFLGNGEEETLSVTYGALAQRVGTLARQLGPFRGRNVLLMYPDDQHFITAFLACQLAGAVAVPMSLPKETRHIARFTDIIEDVDAVAVLTSEEYLAKSKNAIRHLFLDKGIALLVTDPAAFPCSGPIVPPYSNPDDLCFIQYTSGSTSSPKGVLITHRNVLHNQKLIRRAFAGSADSVLCSWLPFYHDMGLVGNILQTVYLGATCVLLLPFHFLEKPIRWLRAISKYRVTHSGGPDFAYQHCVQKIPLHELAGVDLSNWRVAYNGSEPIRYTTLTSFAAKFGPAGFKPAALCPCYGMAEATLYVAGAGAGKSFEALSVDAKQLHQQQLLKTTPGSPGSTHIVASGIPAKGMRVRIIDPGTGVPLPEGQIGEICIAGQSVSKGYWKRTNESIVKLAGEANRRFFKTGDAGFLDDNRLYVTGRLKEMIIIRGKNFFPADFEAILYQADASINLKGVAAFSVVKEQGEALVLVAELARNALQERDHRPRLERLYAAIVRETGVEPYDIVLVKPFKIPRTTSGKTQHLKAAEMYRSGGFEVVASTLQPLEATSVKEDKPLSADQIVGELLRQKDRPSVVRYLNHLLYAKFSKKAVIADDGGLRLSSLGLDSLRSMELINHVNNDLKINLDPIAIYRENTVTALIDFIETTLLVKEHSLEKGDKEIVL